MKTTKKVVKKAKKAHKKVKETPVSMENICKAIDIALDLRFPHTAQPERCEKSWRYVDVVRYVEYRRPTTWEKFVWGDADYAPWKKQMVCQERKWC